jgi:hypothetical protein
MSAYAARSKDPRRRVKHNAWLLALAAACVYGGVIVWYIAGGAA